jgi:TonB family protein
MADYDHAQAGTPGTATANGEAPAPAWRVGSGQDTSVLEPAVRKPGRPTDTTERPAPARPATRAASGTAGVEGERRERLVSQQRLVLGVALLASVGLHVAIFTWTPSFHSESMATSSRALQTIQLPPDVKIPPPPQSIARPATPKVATTDVSPELTIAPTTMEANPASALPPPPPAVGGNPADRPTFIPFDVPPKLLNKAEIERLLVKLYPASLRDVGIGGAVVVWAYVDVKGAVLKTVIKDSSGYPSMDAAAAQVVQQMRFKPAINRDQPIAVWISQKVTMSVQR